MSKRATVGVELLTRFENDRVLASPRVGELRTIADAKRPASSVRTCRFASRCHEPRGYVSGSASAPGSAAVDGPGDVGRREHAADLAAVAVQHEVLRRRGGGDRVEHGLSAQFRVEHQVGFDTSRE